MNLSLIKNKLLWIILTIFLGALGSGLWDLAIKPLFTFATDVIFNFAVSMFDEVQKSIYSEIASLQREITGRIILALGMGVLAGFSLAVITKIIKKRDKQNSKKPAEKADMFNLILSAIFILVFSLFTAGKSGYVIEKQNEYLQLSRIILPYIDSQQERMYSSRFSLITTRSEYETLITEMQDIAKSNNIVLPK